MSELKEYLKVFIKEKENMYKIKIHNKLYGGSGNKRASSGNKKRKRDQIEEGNSGQQNDKKRRRVTDQDSEDSEYSI